MKQTLNLQSDYSVIENGYQLWIPLDCSIRIPEDDPVRLLNAVAERMDYREIEAAYSRCGRIEYSPKILTKVIVYGYMRGIITTREIERACKENICFMYLLEGRKAPDHNTISRFRTNILLKGAGEKLRIQLIRMLIEAGLIDLKTVFIDGTKIEANTNKYSFVWNKAQVKKMAKLNERIKAELPEMLKKAGIRFYVRDTIQLRHLKKLMKQLKTKVKGAGIKFVYGTGNHKTILQRLVEKTDKTVFDKDCGSFIEMRTLRSGGCDHLSVRFTWLNTFADGSVHGIQQSAKLPVHLVQHVLVTRQPVKYLYHEPAAQARIDASRTGKTIRQVIGDKHKRRALCKAMRSCFQWVDETVNLFNDFGDSFYFTTESGFPSNGGLVLFENTYDGHKGLCYQVCT